MSDILFRPKLRNLSPNNDPKGEISVILLFHKISVCKFRIL